MNSIPKPQVISTILMVILIYASSAPIWAQADATTTTTPNSTTRHARAKAKTATAPAAQEEVVALRQLVQGLQQQLSQQSQQINQLQSAVQQLLDVTTQAKTAALTAQTGLVEAQNTAAQAQQAAVEAQKSSEAASSNAGEIKTELAAVDAKTNDANRQLTAIAALASRFRFSGDVRVRGENYTQNTVPDRNRARVRVRFGVDGQLNQDFIAGFALATGSIGDPSSTNETLTNEFDRKTIALDRGFITFNPVAHRWLSLTGGKFPYTWQRTSATFDPDLNPEGFNEKASFDLSSPVVKNFTAQGIELLYNESTTGQDSYALGGQVSANLKIGPWSATPSFLSLKWNRPDAILQASSFAVAATTTGSSSAGPFPINGEGQGCAKGLSLPAYAPCAFAPNGMTNATFVDSKGTAHFYSGYNYADFILNNQVQTGLRRFPVNLLLEFEDNLDAEAHPLNTKGATLSHLGSQNKEYGGDFSLGQNRNKNDMQFGYAFSREEQDAVIASFVESDQRAPTNILQNRFYALWKLRSNTFASFTWWHGRVLNTSLENNAALFNNYSSVSTIKTAGQPEPYLNRFQFDMIYTY